MSESQNELTDTDQPEAGLGKKRFKCFSRAAVGFVVAILVLGFTRNPVPPKDELSEVVLTGALEESRTTEYFYSFKHPEWELVMIYNHLIGNAEEVAASFKRPTTKRMLVGFVEGEYPDIYEVVEIQADGSESILCTHEEAVAKFQTNERWGAGVGWFMLAGGIFLVVVGFVRPQIMK